MDKKYFVYIAPIATLIVGLIIGFMLGGKIGFKPDDATQPLKPSTANRLFTSQTATVRGQIKSVSDQTLTVSNSNGASGNFRASSRILIVKFSTNPKKPASSSSDLQTIELNKDVVLNLEMNSGSYEVTQIQYITPGPALPSFNPSSL